MSEDLELDVTRQAMVELQRQRAMDRLLAGDIAEKLAIIIMPFLSCIGLAIEGCQISFGIILSRMLIFLLIEAFIDAFKNYLISVWYGAQRKDFEPFKKCDLRFRTLVVFKMAGVVLMSVSSSLCGFLLTREFA